MWQLSAQDVQELGGLSRHEIMVICNGNGKRSHLEELEESVGRDHGYAKQDDIVGCH